MSRHGSASGFRGRIDDLRIDHRLQPPGEIQGPGLQFVQAHGQHPQGRILCQETLGIPVELHRRLEGDERQFVRPEGPEEWMAPDLPDR